MFFEYYQLHHQQNQNHKIMCKSSYRRCQTDAKLNKNDANSLRLLSLRNPKKSSRRLCDEIYQPFPEVTTIAPSTRRYLREHRLQVFGRVAVNKPFMRQQNRKRRPTFAKKHKDWTKDDWNKV